MGYTQDFMRLMMSQAGTRANSLREVAAINANAKLQSGQAWAQLPAQLAKIAAGSYQQYAGMKDAQQKNELAALAASRDAARAHAADVTAQTAAERERNAAANMERDDALERFGKIAPSLPNVLRDASVSQENYDLRKPVLNGILPMARAAGFIPEGVSLPEQLNNDTANAFKMIADAIEKGYPVDPKLISAGPGTQIFDPADLTKPVASVPFAPKTEPTPNFRESDYLINGQPAFTRDDAPGYFDAQKQPLTGALVPKPKAKTGQGTGEAVGGPVAKGIIGEAALEGVDPGLARTVKLLTDYKIPLPSGMALKTPYWQKALELASAYDPTFDGTQYTTRKRIREDFTSGAASKNIRSANTAVGHVGTLYDAIEGLNNSRWQPYNRINNFIRTQKGNPAVVKFNVAATAVENELATLFKGTGATDQEIKEWRQALNAAQSPEQLKGAVNQAITLLKSRLYALRDQYDKGMGKPLSWGLLNQHSREILQKHGFDVSDIDPVTTAASPSPAQSPWVWDAATETWKLK